MGVDFTPAAGVLPNDWPVPGPIDLAVHDLPHASSTMEWWYVNAHVTTASGRSLSLFAAFFRVDVNIDTDRPRKHTHFLTWALVDAERGRYAPYTLLDPESPSLALKDLHEGRGPTDARLSRALREMLTRNALPLPDRVQTRPARVALDRLSLDYDGNRLSKVAEGVYELELLGHGGADGCRLRFTLDTPVVRHGDDGVVRGVGGEDLFHYFSPSCRVEGRVRVGGEWVDVAQGIGWYDHEFGERRESGGSESTVGRNWLSAQLDNGWDVSAYDLVDRADRNRRHGRWVILVEPSGERHAYSDFSLEGLDGWTSTKTFNEYPTRYILDVPRAGLRLDVTAAIPGQELATIIHPAGIWEGRVSISGLMRGVLVAGRGFVERSGFSVVDTTDEFFASVGRETRRPVDALLPDPLTLEAALPLISGAGREFFLDGVDLEQYSRTVLRPIREVVLRGSKAWRSYGVLSCMDMVGGDSQRFEHWLALPELLHVGSLIIDDVQNDSAVRRGGPACHTVHGEALAINAGCACYFLAQIPASTSGLSASLLVQIYESYFEAVRSAHVGQAMDIDGLAHLVPAVVASGDGALLERRVLAIHRLKSGAPAGAFARMATLVGGGTAAQADALGRLFESFGMAFQIIDDVLNLRGFEEDRKSCGEDITAGKITAPVAKAMGLLPHHQRQRLWSIVESKPTGRDRIREAIALVDGCGALAACEAQARTLVESAWQLVDPLVPDTQHKVRLRAFGWFVLDRCE